MGGKVGSEEADAAEIHAESGATMVQEEQGTPERISGVIVFGVESCRTWDRRVNFASTFATLIYEQDIK